MTQTELPALPEPVAYQWPDMHNAEAMNHVLSYAPSKKTPWCKALYTADQMRAYALMAREAVEVPQWVSVQERLPKAYHSVLVVNEYGVPILACWSGERWFNDDVTDPLHYVTHWMPLPASPTKGQL